MKLNKQWFRFLFLSIGCTPLPDKKTDSDNDRSSDTADSDGTDKDGGIETDGADTGDSDTNDTTPGFIDCPSSAPYFYDPDDVNARDADAFAALFPTCHENPRDECPEMSTGVLPWAITRSGDLLSAPISAEKLDEVDTGIVELYSTLRCFKDLSRIFINNRILDPDAGNAIRQADFLPNTGLEEIYFKNNDVLEDLRLPPSAKILYLNGNAIRKLDLSNKPNLKYVELQGNRIASPIDVSEAEYLLTLILDDNPIGSITLPQRCRLQWLSLDNTELSDTPSLETELAKCSETLGTLSIESNSLAGDLDLSFMGGVLQDLSAGDNLFSAANLSDNIGLVYISFYLIDSLVTLTLPDDKSNIETLYLNKTGIRALDLEGADALETLFLENTAFDASLAPLDLRDKPALKYIFCAGSQIGTTVDLSASTSLVKAEFPDNRLQSISLPPSAPFLEQLLLGNNELTVISLPDAPKLIYLDLRGNLLRYDDSDAANRLDLTGLPALETVNLESNNDYVLSFAAGTFSDAFLTSPVSRLYIENTKWTAYLDAHAEKPALQYVTDLSGGYLTPAD